MTEQPHVDRVGKCQICSGLIEHYAGEPEDLWHHVEVRDHTPEKRPAHAIDTNPLPGGPVEVLCTCGDWRRVAASAAIADRYGKQHLDSMWGRS